MKNQGRENSKTLCPQNQTSSSKQKKMKPNAKRIAEKLNKKQSNERSPQNKKPVRSVIRLRSRSLSNEEEPLAKNRKLSPSKSGESKSKTGSTSMKLQDKTKVKQDNGKIQKSSGKETQSTMKVKTNKRPSEETSKTSNSKSKMSTQKKNPPKAQELNEFIDLWSLATIGKREASLNATMKVNIMYERQTSPKKGSPSNGAHSPKGLSKSSKSPTQKSALSTVVKTEHESRDNSPKKVDKRVVNNKKTNIKDNDNSKSKKRKVSPYTIFEDEPAPKSKKVESKQTKTKPKKRVKKCPRSLGLGNSNIIEKSPRQASLNAKAIIAMGTEDDIVSECGARTRIYDWMEVRPYFQNSARKMVWVTGHGDPKYTNVRKRKTSSDDPELQSIESEKSLAGTDDGKCNDGVSINLIDSSIQNTLLKTIHEIADPRLLREYLRSQKEDFKGYVDVETCPSPTPVEKVIQLPPSPKKKLSPSSIETIEKPDKQIEKERPTVTSPAKPKPFRVGTPIPQFPAEQRATHMTSFVHHPIPQSFYQGVQQSHPQPQPHPIKVTPYTPNPAYLYQYSTDRQQQNLFVQGSPSAMHYGVENNDLSQRNYQPPSFSFNHMGSLSLGRRGLNPYHQSNTFSPSIHLPVQAFGLNFHTAQYYQPQLQHLPAQPSLSTLQPVSLQQYPLVQQAMMPSHSLVQNLTNQLQSYQPSFSPYTNITSQPMGQDATGMPPPPAPSSNPSPHKDYPNPSNLSAKPGVPASSISPTKSVKSYTCANPIPTESLPLKSTNSSYISKHLVNAQAQKASNKSVNASLNCDTSGQVKPVFSVPTSNPLPSNKDISIEVLPVCKKEHEPEQSTGKKPASQLCEDSPSRGVSHFKVIGENSSVSDILHNAHSAMFPSEAPSFSENSHQQYSGPLTVSTTSKTSQTPKLLKGDGNVRFSVSSILDMPTIKVKSEPYGPTCSKKIVKEDQKSVMGPTQSGAFYICIPTPNIAKSMAKNPHHLFPPQSAENSPASHNPDKKSVKETTVKEMLHNSDRVIIIDDSDSSDDEPLSKLIQSKSIRPKGAEPTSSFNKSDVKSTKMNPNKAQLKCKSISTGTKETELRKAISKQGKSKGAGFDQIAQMQIKHHKEKPANWPKIEKKGLKNLTTTMKKCRKDPSSEGSQTNKNDIFKPMKTAAKKAKVVKGPNLLKKAASKKSKDDVVSQPTSSTIHGWSWIGDGELRFIPKLSQQKEEPLRERMCYGSMRHTSGEVISVKDCVILQSDGDGSAPYVAKVSALWENTNGDMMFSMLWYYQPEHTNTKRESEDGEQELFASKHREENSVACIDDKCYVLMYNEYCRMESEAVRLAQGLPLPRWRELIPLISEEDKRFCRPLPPSSACLDNIWFCRYDYDIRKKIVRKPKHKKTDLRYRAPCKLVS